jgi:hypothetical protein
VGRACGLGLRIAVRDPRGGKGGWIDGTSGVELDARHRTATRNAKGVVTVPRHPIWVPDEAVIRVGDPTAFAFSINGREARSLARAGEAITLHITPDSRVRSAGHGVWAHALPIERP